MSGEVVQSHGQTKLAWAANESHLRGIPRKFVFSSVFAISKFVTSFLNNTRVHNLDTLTHLVHSRPRNTPLITVSNHMTTLDDPLMWGIKGFKCDPKHGRWALAADDICFTNPIFSYFFRLGKCIPISRGAGIYQPHMNEALERLNQGEWVHTFPEGKISQENGPIGRLKWGVASLIVRTVVPPIVLPICHSGFEKVMPENYWSGRRPLLPLCFKNINIVVGEPIVFDIPKLKTLAEEETKKSSEDSLLPKNSASGKTPLQEDKAVLWLYSHLADHLRIVIQDTFYKAKSLNAEKELNA